MINLLLNFYKLKCYMVLETERKNIRPIFFNYGQANFEYERYAVQNICQCIQKKYPGKIEKPLTITAYALYGDKCAPFTLFPWSLSEPITGKKTESKNFIPLEIENKNMTLYSILVSFVLSEIRREGMDEVTIDVYTGLRDKEMGDSSLLFFKHINDALLLYHSQFKFNLHFIESLTPRYIVNRLISLFGSVGTAEGFTKKTASCYTPVNSMPCGNCSKCRDLDKIWSIVSQ